MTDHYTITWTDLLDVTRENDPRKPAATVAGGLEDRAMDAQQIGERIGRAIARDVLADDLPREWTGLDPQDADQIPAGLDPREVEEAARQEYERVVG